MCYSLCMSARLLDGLKIRDQIFEELKEETRKLAAQGVRPGLAAVLVGENPASQLYVKSKIAACEQLALASWLHTPPASISTEQLLQLVRDLNADKDYAITDLDTNTIIRKQGRELMEQGVTREITRKPGAALLAYKVEK